MKNETENKMIVLIISQNGSLIDRSVKYGALYASLETAKYLSSNKKYHVYFAGLSSCHHSAKTEYKDNITYLLAPNEKSLKKLVSTTLKNVDILIQMSRLDYTFIVKSYKHIIYHHNPCKIYFKNISGIGIINFFKIPVICVSNFSGYEQISYSVKKDLIRIIPNGYNPSIFKPREIDFRISNSIIFAGNIIDYKGIDIGLRAFIKIKTHYPNSVFNICGNNTSWINVKNHFFQSNWLDRNGFIIWSVIEKEILGCKYLGELSQKELAAQFQQSSILITPSRIGETFGLVSIESQACGCIPVLPNSGGFIETLENNITGYLYEENTPEKLADTILNLWNKGLPTEQQRVCAQIWTQSNFSWDKAGAKLLEVIENTPNTKYPILLNFFFCWIIAFIYALTNKIKILFTRKKYDYNF
jgi:glycosyltransferase involved in cell wall biosynthesis